MRKEIWKEILENLKVLGGQNKGVNRIITRPTKIGLILQDELELSTESLRIAYSMYSDDLNQRNPHPSSPGTRLLKTLLSVLSDQAFAKAVIWIHKQLSRDFHPIKPLEKWVLSNKKLLNVWGPPSRRYSAIFNDGLCEYDEDDSRLYLESLCFLQQVYLYEFLL